MAVFRIPSALREHCGGQAVVHVRASDLAGALAELEALYPACRDRIVLGDGHLREFVRIFVNDHEVPVEGGQLLAVAADDEISILPSVCGGRD
ncbi:MAG TPA: MoaD/ThiS family protein [Candidatus Dormibacteraeota bacterium]